MTTPFVSPGHLDQTSQRLKIDTNSSNKIEQLRLFYETLISIRDELYQQSLGDLGSEFLVTLEKDVRAIIKGLRNLELEYKEIREGRKQLEKGSASLAVASKILSNRDMEPDAASRLRRSFDSMMSFRNELDNAISYWPNSLLPQNLVTQTNDQAPDSDSNKTQPDTIKSPNLDSVTLKSTGIVQSYAENSRVALSRANLLRESTREPFVYTGHLLAALYLLEGDCPAFTFLSVFGIDRNKILSEVLIPKPEDNRLSEILALELHPNPSEIQGLALSQSVSNVLEKAQQRALVQQADEITPSHLFASLMENTETAVSHWLENTLGSERYLWIQQRMAESELSTSFTTARVQAWAIAAGFYQPPTGMDDEATVEDLLNFKRYTDALASIIVKPETHPPLVVGVYGPWGSGKSTFLQLIRENLQPSKKVENSKGWNRIKQVIVSWLDRLRKAFSKPQGPELVIIEYNAWEYTDAPKLWTGLVAKIAEMIDEKLGWRGRFVYLFRRQARRLLGAVILGLIPVGLFLLTKYSERMGDWAENNTVITGWLTAFSSIGWTWYAYLLQKEPVTTIVRALTTKFDANPAGGIVHNIQEELESAIKIRLAPEGNDQQPEISKADIASRVRANEYKIIVLIDELDRCPLERIVDILEAIKLFLAERIFIVLIAIDTRVAAEAIRLHYKDVENPDLPREYLEKIVQLPLQVPAADNQAIKKYLEEHMPKLKASSSSLPPKSQANDDQAVLPGSGLPVAIDRQRIEPPIPFSGRRGSISRLELPDTQIEFDHIAVLAERFLESNPRRIKRLLNTYRYIKVLASTRHEPIYQDDWQQQMLAWLAFTMRWPAFMSRAIDVADALHQDRVSNNVNKKRHPPKTRTEQFLVQVARAVGTKYERPPYDDLKNFLPINHTQVSSFAKQASNFLIETPTPYPATQSRGKKSATKKKTPKDVKQQGAPISK